MMKSIKIALLAVATALALYFTAHTANAADLAVEIRGVGDRGGVVVALFRKSDKWLSVPATETTVFAKKEGVFVTFRDLAEGEYAISMFVDENSNGRFDVNGTGAPTEPFGFSNNPSANFGQPSFEQAKIVLSRDNRTTIITAQTPPPLPAGLYPTLNQATALFWNPLESGWGCNSVAQTNPRATIAGESKYIMFLSCFIYDKSGRPVWIVVPDARDTAGTGKYFGISYRTTSAGFGTSFNASALGVFPVGSVEFDFSRPSDLNLTLRINDPTRVLEVSGIVDAQGAVIVSRKVQRQVWGVVE